MEKENIYTYKARNFLGQALQGNLVADNLQHAVRILQKKDLIIIDIKLKKYRPRIKKLSLKDLTFFCNQLSISLSAGVPIDEAIKTICNNNSSTNLKEWGKEIIKGLNSGYSLGEICQKYKYCLQEVMVEMIKVGETGGFLDLALYRLANLFEKEMKIKEKLKTVLIYPLFVIAIAFLVINFILIYLIPNFAIILSNLEADLNSIAKVLIIFSTFYKNNIFLILILIATLIFFILYFWKQPKFKNFIEELLIKTPFINNFIIRFFVVRFCVLISQLVKNGIPIFKALDLIEDIIYNHHFKKEINKIKNNLKSGRTLESSFQNSRFFPADLIQIIAVGEISGNLEELLDKYTQYYQQELNVLIARIPKIIEPVLLISISIFITIIIFGILVPFFTVINNIA